MKLIDIGRVFVLNNTSGTDPFRQQARRYGSANGDKTLYYIEDDNKDFGFFAMYRAWLEYLYFADVCGYTPVVYAGDRFAYKEKCPVHGTENPFEYYFEQPASVDPCEALQSRRVIHSDLVHRQMVELVLTGKHSNYKTSGRYMREMGRIAGKYIKFNAQTWEYVSEGIRQMGFEKEKVLGIHIRGTDFRASYDNHPVYLEEEDCFREIDRITDRNAYSKIFIATDDSRILKKFIDRYGSLICCYDDVARGDRNKSVAFSISRRRNHKYLLGLEVIRDMYSLSMCTGLVAGVSQVAICARINKLSRGGRYEDLEIIDKGLNNNGYFFRR